MLVVLVSSVCDWRTVMFQLSGFWCAVTNQKTTSLQVPHMKSIYKLCGPTNRWALASTVWQYLVVPEASRVHAKAKPSLQIRPKPKDLKIQVIQP